MVVCVVNENCWEQALWVSSFRTERLNVPGNRQVMFTPDKCSQGLYSQHATYTITCPQCVMILTTLQCYLVMSICGKLQQGNSTLKDTNEMRLVVHIIVCSYQSAT